MSAAIAEPQSELTRYSIDRQTISFAQMKRDLGDKKAIELECQYLSEELEEIKKLALVWANRILVQLGKPELILWPKGWFDVPQSDCDSCGKPGWCRTISVGLTFPMDCDACHVCREEDPELLEEYQLTTPLEVALNLKVFDNTDYWYVEAHPRDVISIVASDPINFDVYDIESGQIINLREAMGRMDGRCELQQKFAVVLPEDVGLFLNHWSDGLFPELVQK